MIADGILPRSVASERFAGSRLPYFRSSERNSNPGLGWPSFQIEDSRWSPVTSRCITSQWCTGSSCRCAAHAHSVVATSPNSRVIHTGLKGSLKDVQPLCTRLLTCADSGTLAPTAACLTLLSVSLRVSLSLVFRCRQLSNSVANNAESNQLLESRKLAELLGH
jgi:hypothetical protein